MSEATDRLRNLLADELGECRTEDLQQRIAELDELEAGTPLDRAERDAAVFAALGAESRYRLVRVLAAAEGELCVCELNAVVEISSSAVSHALADLTGAGLVERRKDGKWRYYRSTDRAEALLSALDRTREGDATAEGSA